MLEDKIANLDDMARGKIINPSELDFRLLHLDIDEGIRLEQANRRDTKSKDSKRRSTHDSIEKMFVNRRASGTYVVQQGDKFQYLESPDEVRKIINRAFPTHVAIWAY